MSRLRIYHVSVTILVKSNQGEVSETLTMNEDETYEEFMMRVAARFDALTDTD